MEIGEKVSQKVRHFTYIPCNYLQSIYISRALRNFEQMDNIAVVCLVLVIHVTTS